MADKTRPSNLQPLFGASVYGKTQIMTEQRGPNRYYKVDVFVSQ